MAGLGLMLGLLTSTQTKPLSAVTLELVDEDVEHRYAHLSKLSQLNNRVTEQGFQVALLLFLCLRFFLNSV